VAVSGGEAFAAFSKAAQQPAQAAFFRDLECGTRLVAAFARQSNRFGFGIGVYALAERPLRLVGMFCQQAQPAA
jgi:hypothetical protein